MFFETAGIEVAIWVPPLVAFVISFFTSMAGVSGAFLLLPFQMSVLGYTSPSVSATNQVFNMVAIPSGVWSYCREGRMIWPLAAVVVAGTLPGVLIGAIVRVEFLPDPRLFKLFAACVLLYIGARIVRDLFFNIKTGTAKICTDKCSHSQRVGIGRGATGLAKREAVEAASASSATIRITHLNFKRFGYTYLGESFDVSIWGLLALSSVVGIVGGIYGIGGGAIIAPFFVTFFGLPVHTVAGAALMGTFVTSVAGVSFYQLIALYYPSVSVAPDFLLGGLFGLGGMAGMYLGARCQKYVPAKTIKWMLAGIIIFTGLKYASVIIGFF